MARKPRPIAVAISAAPPTVAAAQPRVADVGAGGIANRGSTRRGDIRDRLSVEFGRPHDTVLAPRGQHGLAERDRLEVVPPRYVRLGARFEGAEQAAHGAGERIGEPGVRPSGPVPLAAVA